MDKRLLNKQFEKILNSIADGVFTVDLENNITFFNQAAEKITGILIDQALGQKCFDVFRADICQTSCVMHQTIKTGREFVNLRINILNSQGGFTPISVSTSVLRDKKGRIVGGVETFRDLTAIEILRHEIRNQYTNEGIVSKNHEIRRILDILPDIALSGSTVLIEGPSGTGKELIARAIHNLSECKGTFVAVNCTALPETLFESELFGYKKGAFTEAKKDKPGRFAIAEGGTIFLDEIGDIPIAIQAKLLRVLQDKRYEPLGATATEKADVRIITATNRPLSDLVAQGTFRQDLFYRLNVVRLTLPSLSQRREDIPLLVDHFIRKFNAIKGKDIENISEEAMSLLFRYDYPGNIRELENFVEYAFVLCREKTIQVEHFPHELIDNQLRGGNHQEIEPVPYPLNQAEAKTIQEALSQFKGHRHKTADYLGINKTTLWRKIKKYGINYRPTGEPLSR